jgi:hypothetical protein
MKHSRAGALLLIATLLSPEAALCWGGRAHSVIDRTAVDTLPSDGPVFLKKYVDYIAGSASIPDSWRGASEPFSKIEEDPNHGWFREQFAFMKTIPRSRYEFVLALYDEYRRIEKSDPENARRMNVRWTGTLPYAAVEVYGHLVADMRALRRSSAAGKDTAFLEQTCAFYVAWLGHYIGDGSQPMHDSIYSDGWRGPNPNGYTLDPKIHGRFESQYVEAIGLTEGDIIARVGQLGHLKGDVFDLILTHLNESGSKAEAIYKMDKRNAFADIHDPEAREMVYSQTASGSRMLRDLVYRAWLESSLPPNKDLRNPTDSKNPNYNPQTGSAPATDSPSVVR